MTPEETYLEHLHDIERIAASVARRNRLNADESAEFVQDVRVRLLDDDYAVIRKFKGEALFTTYLMTVIRRHLNHWREERWGKWRPSAEAKRLGDKAITLERMLTREGYTFAEAVKVLTTPAGAPYTVAELEALYVRLPLRNPRPVLVSDDDLPETVAVSGDADERVEARDRQRSARLAATVIDQVLGTCAAEDRVILQMRFWHGLRVPDIARVLNLDQKRIYKRLEKLCGNLRRELERANVSRDDVHRMLSRGDQEIRLEIISDREIDDSGPSQSTGGGSVRGGEGRPR
jgi:RNA polymerase sigma factor (sigma-70 family)